MIRSFRRTSVLASAGTALVLLAAPALAHVTVNSPGATQGGFAKLTFRVPTEKEVATTKLQVVFPEDAPLANANVKPHAGWTYNVIKGKPAAPLKDGDGNTIDSVVQSITWTASEGGIKPGEFDEFDVSAGPLPKADEMVFKALQTYADGSVVRWIEPRVEGGAAPEHPAPVLKLAPAADTTAGSASPSASASSASVEAQPVSDDDSDDDEALVYVALGVGAVALIVSVAALLRGRRTTTT